jgi:hypothetical protein
LSQIDLVSGGVPAGSAINGLAILRADLGLTLINGGGPGTLNAVATVNPQTGDVGTPIALPTITYAQSLKDIDGSAVTTANATFPNAASLFANKVFVSTTNFAASFTTTNPGTVLVYDLTGSSLSSSPRVIEMVDGSGNALYNPAQIVPFTNAAGQSRLAVVVAAGFSQTAVPNSAIVVLDPVAETIESVTPISTTNLNSGAFALASDNTLYLGGATTSELFTVDLSVSPPTIGTPTTVSSSSTFNNISGIALSNDEQIIFVANFNDAAVTLLDRQTLTPNALATGFQRSKTNRTSASTNGGFDNNVQSLLVRPGTPGSSFNGPELFCATISILDPAEQATAGVTTSIDTLEVDVTTGQPTVLIDVDTARYTTGNSGDIQQLTQHPLLPGFFFVVETSSGVVHAISFDDL